jgi:hypothetical protein
MVGPRLTGAGREKSAMKKPFRILAALLSLQVALSCVESQNFDQYEDLSVTPDLEASLLYVEATEAMINEAPGVDFIQETFAFTVFSEQYVADHLLDGVLTYEVENTTSKPLQIRIEFLDASAGVLDSETFLVEAAPTAIVRREINYGSLGGRNIDILRNTTQLRISATNLGDDSSVSTLPGPKILMRSSAQFRFRLK